MARYGAHNKLKSRHAKKTVKGVDTVLILLFVFFLICLRQDGPQPLTPCDKTVKRDHIRRDLAGFWVLISMFVVHKREIKKKQPFFSLKIKHCCCTLVRSGFRDLVGTT